MHILVIDNSEVVQKICTFVLEKGGHTVEVASSGSQALKLLSEKKFDFLFLELFLRDMSALNILEKVKDQKVISVIMTSYHSIDLIQRAIELGASSYIFKPIDPDNIEATLVMCQKRFEMDQNKIEAKNKLLESQQKYKTLVDGISEGIVIIQNNVVRFVNRSMANMLDLKIARAVNKSAREIFARKEADRVYRKMVDYMEKDVPLEGTYGFQNVADKKLILSITANKINFENKPAFMFVFNDVTERVQMSKQIEKIEDRYRILHENASDAFFLIDQEGKIQEWNNIAASMFGYGREELQQMNMCDLIDPNDSARFAIVLNELVSLGGVPPTDISFKKKDGASCMVSLSAVFIDFNTYLIIACNVPAKVPEALGSQVVSNYQDFINSSPLVFYRYDAGGRLEFVSQQVHELIGHSPDMFTQGKLTLENFIHPEDRERVVAVFSQMPKPGGILTQEYRVIDRQENVRWVYDFRRFVEREGGISQIGILCDITHHKENVERVKELETQYRDLLNTVPVLVYSLLYNGNFSLQYASPYLQNILGYPPEECYKSNLNVLIDNIHPSDSTWVQESLKSFIIRRSGAFRLHYRMLGKDGEVRHVVNRGRVRINEYDAASIDGTIVDVTLQQQAVERQKKEAGEPAAFPEHG